VAERDAYVALALVDGMGAAHLGALLSAFGSASDILRATRRRGPVRDGLIGKALQLARHAVAEDAVRLSAQCDDAGIRMLRPADPDFPAALRSIPSPPLLLFSRGQLDLLRLPAVAIVGSRNHTRYGQEVAAVLAGGAAAAGIAVVSGMARGLDAVAHGAALDAAGATIGVLGNGLGVVYPASNRQLYDRVERSGLLLTEHPPGERPSAGSFPRRNRLISGLAKVVVVVEAAQGSGTLVTVSAALEQGRDVMAVPGPITSPTSDGTNQLLRDGAEPVLALGDLLGKFDVVVPGTDVPMLGPPASLSPNEAQVFGALSREPRHIDDIAVAAALPIGLLLGVLCGLELGGLVDQSPGSLFRRTR
jgi:DNA processing protein